MYRKFLLLLVFLIPLWAEPVNDLLDIIMDKNNIIKAQTQMIDIMVGQNPDLKPYKNVMTKWIKTYITWENMQHDMVKIYKKHYTNAEIDELLKFYRTPIGKKNVKLMPVIFGETAQLGADLAKRYSPQLDEMLQKEMK